MISRNVSCRIFQARAEVEGGAPEMPFTGGASRPRPRPHPPSIGGVPPHHQGLFMTLIRFPIGVKESS
jgi:hypothetical protein